MVATRPRRAAPRAVLALVALAALPILSACGSTPHTTAASIPATPTPLHVTLVTTPAATDASVPSTPRPAPPAASSAPPSDSSGEDGGTALVAAPPQQASVDAAPAAPATPNPDVLPARVAIPRIGVNAPIAPLGETSTSAMATPSDPRTVGWWQFGTVPGDRGSAVLGGHLDFHNYGAAVFWNLKQLRPGDSVQVTRADGGVLRFTVQSAAVYPAADTSAIDRIFLAQDAIRLNLITCAGTFNPMTHDYDKRLVVYTTLQH